MFEEIALADGFEIDVEGGGLLLGASLAADIEFPGLVGVLYLVEGPFCGFLHRLFIFINIYGWVLITHHFNSSK